MPAAKSVSPRWGPSRESLSVQNRTLLRVGISFDGDCPCSVFQDQYYNRATYVVIVALLRVTTEKVSNVVVEIKTDCIDVETRIKSATSGLWHKP